MAFRVIADHIRTCVFALSDGATFSNEGRGYVLRRVLRRAMRYARNIGIEKPFLYKIVDVVCENMHDFYPYLMEKKDFVKKLILKEEESFIQTLANGERLLNNELNNVKDGILSGEVIFKLYDTYGFPKEMTIESAEEKGIKCDIKGFEKCMEKQKEMARNARDNDESMHNQSEDLLNLKVDFTFTGYDKNADHSKVIALFKDGKAVDQLRDGGDVVFANSCFYAESGGQCADTGYIYNANTKAFVKDVKKAPNGAFLHRIEIENGTISIGDEFDLEINIDDREKIRSNHTSLHLLQSALKNILGDHVAQAGSYVCKDYARFDFTHYEKISNEDLNKIESLVNEYICANYPITTQVLEIDEAKKTGAIALFDEKYEDKVRVVSMGDVSKEFCGGTHARNTADLGSFKIKSEESIGSGIRRIECCTKMKAYDEFKAFENKLDNIKEFLKLKNIDMVYDRVVGLKDDINKLENQNANLINRVMNLDSEMLVSKALDNGKFKYVLYNAKDISYNLKNFATMIKDKLNGGLAFIGNECDDKYSFVCAIGEKALNCGLDAGDLVKKAAALCNGKGGGKKDLAQSGGSNSNNMTEIISSINDLLK